MLTSLPPSFCVCNICCLALYLLWMKKFLRFYFLMWHKKSEPFEVHMKIEWVTKAKSTLNKCGPLVGDFKYTFFFFFVQFLFCTGMWKRANERENRMEFFFLLDLNKSFKPFLLWPFKERSSLIASKDCLISECDSTKKMKIKKKNQKKRMALLWWNRMKERITDFKENYIYCIQNPVGY